MTLTEEVTWGVSRSSPRLRLKARAMRRVTARVGLACSRSIWLSMERLTPLALARASRDQARSERRRLTRSPRWRLIDSGSVGAIFLDGERSFIIFMLRSHLKAGQRACSI